MHCSACCRKIEFKKECGTAAMQIIDLKVHVSAAVRAPILKLQQSISFWGGVDVRNGLIIDAQHPDAGKCVTGSCLVLPGIRGSTAASGALLECIYAGCGPAAIILAQSDPTALIAVLAAQHIGLPALPVCSLLNPSDLALLHTGTLASIDDSQLTLED
jgi:predicted aconitase with swiveling domain